MTEAEQVLYNFVQTLANYQGETEETYHHVDYIDGYEDARYSVSDYAQRVLAEHSKKSQNNS